MSRVPLSGAPHGSGKVRLGFTYRITTLSILHSAAVGPAHSLSGTIETDCPPARPLTSSAAVRAPLPHASAALSKLHVQPLRFPATPTDSSRTVQARRDINTSPVPKAFITNTPPTPPDAATFARCRVPAPTSPSLATRRAVDTWYTGAASVSACSCRRVSRAPMLKRRRSRARTLPPT